MEKTKTYETLNGYFIAIGSKGHFIESTNEKRTAALARVAIKHIGRARGFCEDLITRIKNDPATVKRIQHDMQRATLTKKYTDGVRLWYAISGADFGGGYDPSEVTIYRHLR